MPDNDTPRSRKPDLVSVIIPVFNGLPLLEMQLEGLGMQDYSGSFEVIISDNGSTDGLADYIDRHPLRESLRLQRVDSSDRPGAPHARNVGADAAKGDFLAFTDQDDRVHPTWLSALVAAAADYDSVGGPIETVTLNSPKVARWRPSPAPNERFTSHYLYWAHGNNIGMWRTVFEKVGGFDESMVCGDDIDISWSIQEAGMTLGHAPDALVAYRLRPRLWQAFRQAVGYGRTQVDVYLKHSSRGCPPYPLRSTLITVAVVILCNPAFVFMRKWVPTGLWALHAGVLTGRIRGCIHHRTWAYL
ncbi:glycosyltransferase [Nocardia sp. CDC160]|uniref:glycosyltransferase n=1 Tax=Nocardia sp. CDC160 TaxID=3112166 RepID=UPI002DB5D22A|nr:glycosyltransferase [Nocardia sp. CDC160]MEC3920239.1 glycosyltransferase [Nocardia sp. CDC160]